LAAHATDVDANFRQDCGRGQGADAWYGEEQSDQGAKAGLTGRCLLVHGLDRGAHLLVHLGNPGLRRVVLIQVWLEQEATMSGQAAV
jgi:hypothetical protein